MSVSKHNPAYDKYVDRWQLVKDVVASDVKKYVLDIDPSDTERCKRYKHDACFTNFTGRTKNGLVGAVFAKDVQIQLPSDIEYLISDATGSQMSLSRLAQEVTGEVLQTGRYGLLVDYPASEEGLTVAEVSNLNLKARICRYPAENIINWQATIVNGLHQLVLVVLKEFHSKLDEDGFTWIEEYKYRVLRLIDGKYIQQLYNEDEQLEHEYTPRDFNGSPWNYIPFVFVGSEDNDECVDPSPLYDLAQLNLGHLRNSADYEESVHVTGQPTLIIATEMSGEQFKAANPTGVKIGSRRGLNLGPNGSAQLLQPTPNQLADEAMKRKEEQAVMIGARLITPVSANETAEAARIKHSSENSVLATIVHNVNDAIRRCIIWVSKFMSPSETAEEIVFEISDKFFDEKIDPLMISAQLQLYQNALIAPSDLRQNLREVGVIKPERTDEDIDSEIAGVNPLV